jgi:hypothetical protein
MMRDVIPKAELLRTIKKFLDDENRGISQANFADLAGVDLSYFLDVFREQITPMSEYMQRRVSKAYRHFQAGEVAVMTDNSRERWVEYRKNPKPRLKRGYSLQMADGQIKLKIGVQNRCNYESLTLDEQLKGK